MLPEQPAIGCNLNLPGPVFCVPHCGVFSWGHLAVASSAPPDEAGAADRCTTREGGLQMEDARPALGRRLAALVAIAGLISALVAVGFAVIRGDAWRVPLVLVAV